MPKPAKLLITALVVALPALACGLRSADSHAAPTATTEAPAKPVAASAAEPVAPPAAAKPTSKLAKLLARARLEVVRGVDYDPAYRVTTYRDGVDTGKVVYPGGDVEPGKGVCTDVVVRSLRAVGIDLQPLVHDAALAHPGWFPTIKTPDANIDHRRVPALMAYFDHAATASLPTATASAADRATFQPGDLVIWSFSACPKCSPRHIGVVSDKLGPRGLPLVIHNLGPHPTEDDDLDAWTILRHVRVIEP